MCCSRNVVKLLLLGVSWNLVAVQVQCIIGRVLNVPNLTTFSIFLNMELPSEQVDDHFAIGKFLTSLPLTYRYIASSHKSHHARHPRDLHGLQITPIEKLFDSLGLNGKRIVLKHICQSALAPLSDAGFIVEIIDTVLRYAAKYHRMMGDVEYMDAYNQGLMHNNCDKFSGGPSLFTLAELDP